MSTPAEFATEAAADILSGTSATVRMTHDLRDDRDHLALGETRFALAVDVIIQDTRDVSHMVDVCTARVVMWHRLLDWTDPRAYREAAMLTDQQVLLDQAFWQDMASVLEYVEPPNVPQTSERDGHVIAYELTTSVRLVP
jgi:hypothetical protein